MFDPKVPSQSGAAAEEEPKTDEVSIDGVIAESRQLLEEPVEVLLEKPIPARIASRSLSRVESGQGSQGSQLKAKDNEDDLNDSDREMEETVVASSILEH